MDARSMTRDEYIEANWQRFSDRGPPAGDWPESVARARAGKRWDRDRQPDRRFHAWAEARSRIRGPGMAGWPIAASLLWAVALELDEQLPLTQTGEMVCVACSGWGWEIVALDHGRFIDPGFMARARRRSAGILESVGPPPGHHPASGVRTRIAIGRCVCNGGVRTEDRRRPVFRPHTVQLHRIVETIAAMRSPMVDDWPEQWLVDLDQRAARGDRSPKAVWWAQFFAWTLGGLVDEQALADALDQLVQARREVVEARRRVRMLKLLSEPPRRVDPWGREIRVDGENPVVVTFGVDYASGPDSTVVAEIERSPDGSLRTLSISTPWRNDDLGARLLAPDRDRLHREMIGEVTTHGSGYGRSLRSWAPGQIQGHRHTQVIFDEVSDDAGRPPPPLSEWPFLDP